MATTDKNIVEFEEVRVSVSISYTLLENQEDEDLLRYVDSAGDFIACELQRYGCAFIPYGFVIFQSDRIPNKTDKKRMIASVKRAIKVNSARFYHTQD